MLQDDEQTIVDFLKRESFEGHFESTTAEIANGVEFSYNQVSRIVERLIMLHEISYRERGTARKSVRYFYLNDLLTLWKEKCHI
jgi:hypothetical protein